MKNLMKTMMVVAGVGLLATACARPADEFRSALPDREVVEVDFPEEESTSRGLIASQSQAVVGGPATYYTQTYYESRKINAFGKFMIDILEAVTAYPPTELAENRAVWGPFSEDDEPNEFRLVVEEVEADVRHYRWALQGRHKSVEDFTDIAGGTLEPDDTNTDYGRGWFVVSFENIRELDPSEDGRGTIAYAFVKNAEGVQVRVLFEGPNDGGTEIARGAYAYGKDIAGAGFVTFLLHGDMDEGEAGKEALESLVIHSRWGATNVGRADVVATGGDLGRTVMHVSQCWDTRFTSTYERGAIDGATVVEDGDVTTCQIPDAQLPDETELPSSMNEIESPYDIEIE